MVAAAGSSENKRPFVLLYIGDGPKCYHCHIVLVFFDRTNSQVYYIGNNTQICIFPFISNDQILNKAFLVYGLNIYSRIVRIMILCCIPFLNNLEDTHNL